MALVIGSGWNRMVAMELEGFECKSTAQQKETDKQ